MDAASCDLFLFHSKHGGDTTASCPSAAAAEASDVSWVSSPTTILNLPFWMTEQGRDTHVAEDVHDLAGILAMGVAAELKTHEMCESLFFLEWGSSNVVSVVLAELTKPEIAERDVCCEDEDAVDVSEAADGCSLVFVRDRLLVPLAVQKSWSRMLGFLQDMVVRQDRIVAPCKKDN